MSQRRSGYRRIEHDRYETPEWVTEALLPHIRHVAGSIYEPACGGWKMTKVLSKLHPVISSDIIFGDDFLKTEALPRDDIRAIITNPPYSLAREFIERALMLTKERCGLVAMILRTDYDHAKSRAHLFRFPFAKKLVLRRRIRWFEGSRGKPSFNHAWFIWDWTHVGPPILAYQEFCGRNA